MKHISLLFTFFLGTMLSAQVTSEPKEIDPESTVKIIVNLNQLDQSKDYVTNLLDSADAGADMYIWTFSPVEHPAGHPLVNGSGERSWQNSNDTLKMTKEGDRLYSYTMIPTDFYEVEPAVVYEKDIKFLVKPKNGGGFGDPDNKSDDLTLAVDPPKVTLDPAYIFPSAPRGDDLVSINYDNDRETKPSMQNLAPDEVFFYAEALLEDSTSIQIQRYTTVSSNPKLNIPEVAPSTFQKYFIPNEFFEVPSGQKIIRMTFIVTKRSSFTGPDDRVEQEIVINLDCG